MKTDLDYLIEHLEEEKQQLEALLKENLEAFDYKRAHRNQQALIRVKQQLEVFYAFKYPDREKREQIARRIDGLQAAAVRSKARWVAGATEVYDQEVDRLLEELYQLQPNRLEDTQALDDAIFELLEGKISGFKLHLDRKYDLYLSFKLIPEHQLLIAFTPAAELKHEHVLYNETTCRQLETIGFTRTTNQQHLQYTHDVRHLRDATGIKTVLARVLFEVRFYRPFRDTLLEKY